MTAFVHGHDPLKDRLLAALSLYHEHVEKLREIPDGDPNRRQKIRQRRLSKIRMHEYQRLLNALYAPDSLPREAFLGRKDPTLSNLNGPRVYTE